MKIAPTIFNRLVSNKLFYLTVPISLLFSGLSVFILFYVRYIIDEVISVRSLDKLLYYLILFLITAIVRLIIENTKCFLIQKVSNETDSTLSEKYLSLLLEMPYLHYLKYSISDLLQRIDDIIKARTFLFSMFYGSLIDFIFLIVGLFLLFYENWKLCIISIFISPFLVILNIFMRNIYLRNYEQAINDQVAFRSSLLNDLVGLSTIRCSQSYKKDYNDTLSLYKKLLNSSKKSNLHLSFQSSVTELVNHMAILLFLGYGATQVISSEISLGQLMVFLSLVNFFFFPLNNIVHLIPYSQEYKISCSRVDELFTYKEVTPISNGLLQLRCDNFDISNLSFSVNDKKILVDLTLSLEKGDKVAICGKNGCGKTTLLRILAKLYNYSEGSITVDATSLNEIDHDIYRRFVSYIPQDTFLYNSTIQDNLFRGFICDKVKLTQILQDIGILGLVGNIDSFLKVRVGENGCNLSSGQKQLIVILKSLLQDAQVFLYDEAFSNLSQDIEKKILLYIKNFRSESILVSITHNVSSLYLYKRIIYIHQGKLTEASLADIVGDVFIELDNSTLTFT